MFKVLVVQMIKMQFKPDFADAIETLIIYIYIWKETSELGINPKVWGPLHKSKVEMLLERPHSSP